MIDFVSTREGTDQQTAACAKLLAAVIAHAINDACTPIGYREKTDSKNLDVNARDAINSLFSNDSVFPLYASLIGSSAEAIRVALLDKPDTAIIVTSKQFSDMDRRILRIRKSWHVEFRTDVNQE